MRRWYEARWTGGYDWDRPGYSPDTGPFTQVVWKDTEKLGCGRASGTPEGEESSAGSGTTWEHRSAAERAPATAGTRPRQPVPTARRTISFKTSCHVATIYPLPR